MRISKKQITPIDPQFIVYNEFLQFFIGLSHGGTVLRFSDNYDDAKKLDGENQFYTLKRIYKFQLEKEYI